MSKVDISFVNKISKLHAIVQKSGNAWRRVVVHANQRIGQYLVELIWESCAVLDYVVVGGWDNFIVQFLRRDEEIRFP